jgi:hypothetical protein
MVSRVPFLYVSQSMAIQFHNLYLENIAAECTSPACILFYFLHFNFFLLALKNVDDGACVPQGNKRRKLRTFLRCSKTIFFDLLVVLYFDLTYFPKFVTSSSVRLYALKGVEIKNKNEKFAKKKKGWYGLAIKRGNYVPLASSSA